MDSIITTDWSEFGEVEIKEAKELLAHIKEIDSSGKVEVTFNKHSGYVFLTDEDLRVWMLNDGKIEEYFNCPVCGHEGFKEEFNDHNNSNQECVEFERELLKE